MVIKERQHKCKEAYLKMQRQWHLKNVPLRVVISFIPQKAIFFLIEYYKINERMLLL